MHENIDNGMDNIEKSKYDHSYDSKNPLNDINRQSDSECDSEKDDDIGLSINIHPLVLDVPLTAEPKSPLRPGTPMPKQMKYGGNGYKLLP